MAFSFYASSEIKFGTGVSFILIIQLQPIKEVSGLRWGDYVGSPAHGDPVLAWTKDHGSVVSTVVSLPTGDVFGLGPCSTLLVMYSKEIGTSDILVLMSQCRKGMDLQYLSIPYLCSPNWEHFS